MTARAGLRSSWRASGAVEESASLSVNRLTPAGLKRRLELERANKSFLEHPGAEGSAEIFELPPQGRVTIGRDDSADVLIERDEQVSRVHAELERIGSTWVISDDGLSRNGTWIGGTRIAGRRRLADGDAVRIGRRVLVFRDPAQAGDLTAATSDDPQAAPITRHAAPDSRGPMPPVPGRLGIRGAGDEQGDCGGGVPLDRGGEGAPQGAV